MLSGTDRTCAVCHEASQQVVILSTNEMGPADLDFRPPQMMRSTMRYWVEECPHCGYVYGQIDTLASNAGKAINSVLYRENRASDGPERQIDRFAKASLVAENASEFRRAAGYALNTAWAADDADLASVASSARLRAYELFRAALETEQDAEQIVETRVQMIDLLRRAEKWDEAMTLAVLVLQGSVTGILRSVLLFQITAINRRDGRCYTMQDVEQHSMPKPSPSAPLVDDLGPNPVLVAELVAELMLAVPESFWDPMGGFDPDDLEVKFNLDRLRDRCEESIQRVWQPGISREDLKILAANDFEDAYRPDYGWPHENEERFW